jgi:tetraacyldisaccharide 4'-kinase
MKKNTAFFFLLFPFSFFFGIIAALRRKAFQKKWLRSATFAVPTICIGNLRVGGTGKTPHVEYIAKFLSQHYQTAILSRGYGRKTKGYINAHDTLNLSSTCIGDEPMQYATKFPNVEVAVCKKRKTGIEKLVLKNPELKVVILDDAYQHLSVNYSLRILLTEYYRPFFEDFLLPSGRLRECRNASKQADIIIVTKCPENLTAQEKAGFLQKLKPQNKQNVFFTRIEYMACSKTSLYFEGALKEQDSLFQKTKILLLTGIANPTPLVQYLKKQSKEIHALHFPDHHSFTNKDIERIIRTKEKLGGKNCTIITTEKDAMRLQAFENMPEYYSIPIEIAFLENETGFKEKLLSLLHHDDA